MLIRSHPSPFRPPGPIARSETPTLTMLQARLQSSHDHLNSPKVHLSRRTSCFHPMPTLSDRSSVSEAQPAPSPTCARAHLNPIMSDPSHQASCLTSISECSETIVCRRSPPCSHVCYSVATLHRVSIDPCPPQLSASV